MITNWTSNGNGEYRIFADGWWADVEHRWDRATGEWRVSVLDTNAYGRVPVAEIALAANEAIGGGQTPEAGSSMASASGSSPDRQAARRRAVFLFCFVSPLASLVR